MLADSSAVILSAGAYFFAGNACKHARHGQGDYRFLQFLAIEGGADLRIEHFIHLLDIVELSCSAHVYGPFFVMFSLVIVCFFHFFDEIATKIPKKPKSQGFLCIFAPLQQAELLATNT